MFSSPSTTMLHTYISHFHFEINHYCAFQGADAQFGPEGLFPCTQADVSQRCVESAMIAQRYKRSRVLQTCHKQRLFIHGN